LSGAIRCADLDASPLDQKRSFAFVIDFDESFCGLDPMLDPPRPRPG
jgi:hypothetical protein